MAAQSDGSIVVDTGINSEKFKSGVKELRLAMEGLAEAIERIGKKMESAVSVYTKSLTSGVKDVQRIQDGVKRSGSSAKDALSEMTAKTKEMSAASDKTAESYGRVAREADKAKAALSGISEAESKASTSAQQAGKDVESAAKSAAEALREEIHSITVSIENYDRDFQNVQNGALSANSALLESWLKGYEQAAERYQAIRLQFASMNESGQLSLSESDLSKITQGLFELEERARASQEAIRNFAQEAHIDLNSDEDNASVITGLESEINAAEAAFDKFQAKVDKMDAIGATDKAWTSVAYDIEKAAEKVVEYAEQIQGLKDSGAIDDETFKRLCGLLDALMEKGTQVADTVKNNLPNAFGDMENSADSAEKSLKGVDRELKQKGPDAEKAGKDVSVLGGIFDGLSEKVRNAEKALAKLAGAAVLAGLRAIGQAATGAAQGLSRMSARAVTGGIRRLGAWLSNAAKSMTIFGRSAKRNNGILKKSFTTILKYGLGVRSFYFLFRKVRQAIAEGYQNLARYSDTLNQSVSGVISSFKRFENQFAASFEPLVNIVAPAIARMIDGLTEATYRAGQFIAALSGQKTVIRAKEVQENYAASLDKTKKAAKDAERQLAEFDRLTILKKPDEAESLSPEDMFETVPVDDKAKDFADAFKEAWVNVDLSDIGGTIGGKLKIALDNIPWPDIQQGAEDMGKRLATFLNGLINVPDLGKSIGKSLAEAVNTAFAFLDGFVWEFEWGDLGNALMDAIEAACDNLEWERINHALQGLAIGLADLLNTIFSRKEVWEKIGRTVGEAINAAVLFGLTFLERFNFKQAASAIVAGLNAAVATIRFDNIGQLLGDLLGGALQFLYTAVTEFDWVKLGNQIAVGVNAFSSTVRRKIYDINWADMGTAIADGINTAIIGIEWEGVGETVGMLFGGALTAVASFIRGLNYGEIVQAIQDFFSGAIQQIDFYDLITVWGVAALIVAVKTIIAKHPVLAVLVGAVLALGPELGNAVHKMVSDIPWEELGQNLSDFLVNALNRLHEAIQRVNWFELGQSVGRFLGKINWSEIVNAVFKIIGDLIIAGFKTLGGVIVGMGPKGILNALWALVKVVGAYIGGKTLLTVLSAGAKSLLSSFALNIVSGITTLGAPIANAISALTAKIGAALSAGAPVIATAALAVFDAVAVVYDVKKLGEIQEAYVGELEAHNKETENALNNFEKLYREKGPEVAAQWAKACYDIDVAGQGLEEAQRTLVDKIDSFWADTPDNFARYLYEGFANGLNDYFGEGGKGLWQYCKDIFGGFIDFVRGIFKEGSPSKVMEEIGGNVNAGFLNGVSGTWPSITDFFTNAFNYLKTTLDGEWMKISGAASTAWNGISTTLSGAWENIKTDASKTLGEVSKTVSDKWGAMKTDASKTWNELKAFVGQAVSGVKQEAVSKVSETANSVRPQWARVKTDAVSEWNGLKSSVVSSALSVKSQVASAFQSLRGTLSGVWGGIRSAASGALASVSSTVSSMVTSISSRVSSIQSTVSNITSSASNALSKVANKMDDLTRRASNGVSLGGFASGGVVRDGGRMSWWDGVRKYASGTVRAAGSLFVAGEAGPEIVGHVNGRTEVLNESQIAGAIYSAVLAAMGEAVKTFGSWLSTQMASNTNALITAIGQIQAPEPIAVSQTDAALMERLAALSSAPYQVPAYATGTVMPYEVVAEIRRQTSEITSAIHDEGEEIIRAIVSAIANHGLSITDAIGKMPAGQGQSYGRDDMARYTIDEINRRTRMNGRSPLLS